MCWITLWCCASFIGLRTVMIQNIVDRRAVKGACETAASRRPAVSTWLAAGAAVSRSTPPSPAVPPFPRCFRGHFQVCDIPLGKQWRGALQALQVNSFAVKCSELDCRATRLINYMALQKICAASAFFLLTTQMYASLGQVQPPRGLRSVLEVGGISCQFQTSHFECALIGWKPTTRMWQQNKAKRQFLWAWLVRSLTSATTSEMDIV